MREPQDLHDRAGDREGEVADAVESVAYIARVVTAIARWKVGNQVGLPYPTVAQIAKITLT